MPGCCVRPGIWNPLSVAVVGVITLVCCRRKHAFISAHISDLYVARSHIPSVLSSAAPSCSYNIAINVVPFVQVDGLVYLRCIARMIVLNCLSRS